jgi:hypothetical protein
MKTFRQFMAIMGVMIAVCIIPCLLPAETPENDARIEWATLATAQDDGEVVTDLGACQNSCRMRYGSRPPTGFSDGEDRGAKTEKNPGATVEQYSPGRYTDCMGECERNYWKQFDKETK